MSWKLRYDVILRIGYLGTHQSRYRSCFQNPPTPGEVHCFRNAFSSLQHGLLTPRAVA